MMKKQGNSSKSEGGNVVQLDKASVRRFLNEEAEHARPMIARLDREAVEAQAQAHNIVVTNERKE